MKKQVMIAAGLALLSTSAYATKARMDALQQNNGRGSEYIKDTRSIFRNPAHVNTFKNYVVTEWGENRATVDADSELTPQAEGGFFKETGNFAWGVYLGSQLDSQNAIRNGNTNSYASAASTSAANTFGNGNFEAANDRLDLFFGGDMGVEWGVNLNHAYSKAEGATANLVEAKHSQWGLGAGVVVGDLELYLNHRFSDKSTGQAGSPSSSSSDWEGKHTLVGAAFGWNNYTFFANYDVRQAEFKENDVTAVNETERKTFRLGAGKIHNISSSSRVYTDLTFQVQTSRDKLATSNSANTSPKVKDTTLPLVIGFETDANSWLTLRGSVSQNVLLKTRKLEGVNGTNHTQEQTIDGNVNVNAGATLNFGKLKIDGAIGTTDRSQQGAGGATNADDGDLRLDRLMGRVAVHYWF